MIFADLSRSRLARVSCLALLALSTGCGIFGGPAKSAIEPDTLYEGPPARVELMQGRHIAVFSAPTSGWSASFDFTDAAYRQRHVFVTLQRPDPSLMVSQALVEHRIDTTVFERDTITVFARTVAHGAEPELSPYRPAVSAQGSRGAQGARGAR